jgi:hypothetical protein
VRVSAQRGRPREHEQGIGLAGMKRHGMPPLTVNQPARPGVFACLGDAPRLARLRDCRCKFPRKATPPTPALRGAEECGWSGASDPFAPDLTSRYCLQRSSLPARIGNAEFRPSQVLTFAVCNAYISQHSARRRLGATARLRSSSLIFGDQGSDFHRKLQASTALGLMTVLRCRRVGTRLVELGPGLFDK